MRLEQGGKPDFHARRLDRTVSLTCADGTPLVGTWFLGNTPKATIVLNSGTGIPRRFYARFAAWLAERGFAVLTYDYRGIGHSKPRGSLRGFKASMTLWAEQDMTAAIAWAKARHPELPLYVIGHSIGGQLLGLAQNTELVSGVVSVAASTGSWQSLSGSLRWLSAAMWYGVVPATTSTLGYAPTKKPGWGENLPAGVAREWATWCKSPDYFLPFLSGAQIARVASFKKPWFSLAFTDDSIANETTVAALLRMYASLTPTVRWFSPEQVGAREIGHLGFFTLARRDLWHNVSDQLDAWLAREPRESAGYSLSA